MPHPSLLGMSCNGGCYLDNSWSTDELDVLMELFKREVSANHNYIPVPD